MKIFYTLDRNSEHFGKTISDLLNENEWAVFWDTVDGGFVLFESDEFFKNWDNQNDR